MHVALWTRHLTRIRGFAGLLSLFPRFWAVYRPFSHPGALLFFCVICISILWWNWTRFCSFSASLCISQYCCNHLFCVIKTYPGRQKSYKPAFPPSPGEKVPPFGERIWYPAVTISISVSNHSPAKTDREGPQAFSFIAGASHCDIGRMSSKT